MLFYCWLPSPDHAVVRVRERVPRGGHFVDAAVIRRRYSRGLKNFFEIYRTVADEWHFLDNAGKSGPRLIAFQPLNGKLQGSTRRSGKIWWSNTMIDRTKNDGESFIADQVT